MISIQGGRFVPIPFDTMIDPETGRTRVRSVDVTSTRYAIARRYMIRLKREDFEDPHDLAKLAATAHLSVDEFRDAVRLSDGARAGADGHRRRRLASDVVSLVIRGRIAPSDSPRALVTPLLDDQRALHAEREVPGERAEEGVAARLRRHLEGDLDRLARAGERRVGDDRVLHRRPG